MKQDKTTPTNTIQKELQDKWEVSPYKAGMIGVGFNDPKTSEGICQVFGANPNEKAELIVKSVNEYTKILDMLKRYYRESMYSNATADYFESHWKVFCERNNIYIP